MTRLIFHRLLVALLCSGLCLQAPVCAAQMSLKPQIVHQLLSDMMLNEFFVRLRPVKTGAGLFALPLPYLTKADRKTLEKYLLPLKTLPPLERLNRGVAFTLGGRRHTVAIDDVATARFIVDGKAEWRYNPSNPIEIQLQVLSRALSRSSASVFDHLVPRAEALTGVEVAFAIFMALILVPVGTEIVNKLIWPAVKGFYCFDKTPSSSYADSEFCSAYFAWVEANRSKLPPGKPVKEPQAAEVKFDIKHKCRTKSEPMTIELESEDKSVSIRRVIEFDKQDKPRTLKEEFVKPQSKSMTYELSDTGTILTVSVDGKLVYSRKKEDSDWMTPEMHRKLSELDRNIDTVAPFIKMCDSQAERGITSQAGAAADVIAPKVPEIAPAPAPKAGPADATN